MSGVAKVSKISVALTPEMTEMAQQAVAGGVYASSSGFVREALRKWKLRRTLKSSEQGELRRLWAEGLVSGPGQFEDIEAIKREARKLAPRRQRDENDRGHP